MATAKKSNYAELSSELDEIMLEMQKEDLDVDEALKYYERGLALVAELEDYLKTAENTVTKLKAKFTS